jgi:TolB-like protein/DNA-binding winged helix-turn-helix (wHTH) protein/tetratricopeptide (TPR) repeat protein
MDTSMTSFKPHAHNKVELAEHIPKYSFHLGDFLIEPARCTILTAQGEVRVEPKVMDVLLLMVAHAGQVVTRDDFNNTIWNGTFVTDEVLSRCIYRLRQALGDNPREPLFIETVSKRGYRLIASVRKTTTVAHAVPATSELPRETSFQQQSISGAGRHGLAKAKWKHLYWIVPTAAVCISVVGYLIHFAGIQQPVQVSGHYAEETKDTSTAYPKAPEARNSIAVLPFVNMSDNPENDYFCDGISEELIGLLAKVPPLKVVARTSSFVYKDKGTDVRRIAELLGVDNVLEGSVRLVGNHIRVSAQLIDASTGYHLWADTFDTQFEDVFAVQDQIAGAIVRALKVPLDAEDGVSGFPDRTAPTADMTAYRLYLQGLYHWKRRGEPSIRKSIDLFKAAIEHDPAFAYPYQALSTAYLVLPFYSRESRADAFAQAEVAARKALELDPTLGKAQAVLAFISLKRWDWSVANQRFQHAFSVAPNDPTTHQWYSEFLSYVGYIDASNAEALRARELDPVSPVINDRLGVTYLWSAEYELAAEQFRIATELGIDRIAYDQAYALLLLRTGQIESAVSLYEKILGKLGLDTDWVRPVAEATNDPALVPEALEAVVLAREEGSLPDAMVFYAAVLLSQLDLAFDAAKNLLVDKSLTVEFLFSPEAARLRRDPRFPQLLAATGLDEYWDQHGWPGFCKRQLDTVVCN